MSLLLDVAHVSPLEVDPARWSDIESRSDPISNVVPCVSKQNFADTGDTELMRLIGAGNREAFSVFCRRHAGRCFAVAHHLLRNAADAEEVVQDAFLRVWQNADRWRVTEARVTTWLFRVVVNLSLDQMRRATRLSVSIEHAAEVVASDPSPEILVGQRELARVISRAVAALPPRQRAALSLVVCDGLECGEAAKVMQVTVGTMESLLVRGRRQLRAALAEATQEQMRAAKPLRIAPRAASSPEPASGMPLAALSGLGA